LTFTGLQGQSPDAEQTRREGSSLLLECPYTAQQGQQKQLSWGRLTADGWQVLAEISHASYPTTNKATVRNVILRGDRKSRTVTIVMTNLKAEDSGTYGCTLRSSSHSQHLPLKVISLNVYKELHQWELDTLSVQCKYRDLEHRTAPRVWCRRGPSGCQTWMRTNSTWTSSRAQGGRVLMQDDTGEGTVTVTMKMLQARDAGTYWCALQRDWQPVRVMEFRLFVSKSKYTPAASCAAPCSQLCYPPRASCGTPHPIASCGTPCSQLVTTFLLLSVVLSILLILALVLSAVLCVWWCRQWRRRGSPNSSEILPLCAFCLQVGSTERKESSKGDSKDLKYATLNFEAQPSPKDALYCNIEPSQAQRRPRDDNVQYATIGLQ
ncbi:CLM8 protein, partial [Psilopogon haemacephalus]|nr:CLM8 protein [Psilopogon haemacephalus]